MDVGHDQQGRRHSQSQRRLHVLAVRDGIGAVRSSHLGGCQAGQIRGLVARGRCCGGYV